MIIKNLLKNMKNFSDKVEKILAGEADPAYKRRAGIILENIKGSKVLEVGCGRGFYLKTIKKLYPTTEIIGIDKNKKYIKGLEAIEADAQKLPFGANSFDTVIASEILEHVDDDDKVLAEIKRVLRPRGVVLISVPNANYPLLWDPLNWFLERIFGKHISSNLWWLAGIWADHKRLYDKENLDKKIKKAGLKIEKSWRTTHYCLPFSHFLFYAIGKNLVEKGWFNSMNRFENQRKSLLREIILWPIKIIDHLNDGKDFETSVNLIYKIRK